MSAAPPSKQKSASDLAAALPEQDAAGASHNTEAQTQQRRPNANEAGKVLEQALENKAYWKQEAAKEKPASTSNSPATRDRRLSSDRDKRPSEKGDDKQQALTGKESPSRASTDATAPVPLGSSPVNPVTGVGSLEMQNLPSRPHSHHLHGHFATAPSEIRLDVAHSADSAPLLNRTGSSPTNVSTTPGSASAAGKVPPLVRAHSESFMGVLQHSSNRLPALAPLPSNQAEAHASDSQTDSANKRRQHSDGRVTPRLSSIDEEPTATPATLNASAGTVPVSTAPAAPAAPAPASAPVSADSGPTFHGAHDAEEDAGPAFHDL